ncbi:Protease-associated domain-containing protein 1-like protein [Dinothrombium tinctorium]|uniref:Protease-associated domain-containing protein 1-like protein n=1 Tax=Dinothrombium tinctorium TaxID=1965070 RepID=A0A3S3P4T8_9ACAR|nr:Protease-associated domain-containing protein 1-like protein [Dinothrombium tinctorium]
MEPQSLRYTFRARPAQNFGVPFKVPLTKVPLMVVEPSDACVSLINQKVELKNNIGLVERGGCSFLSKCIQAENSGLIAVLIYDNKDTSDEYIDMIDDNTNRNCSIPAAFILGRDGYMIRRYLIADKLNSAIINIPINITAHNANKHRNAPWNLI